MEEEVDRAQRAIQREKDEWLERCTLPSEMVARAEIMMGKVAYAHRQSLIRETLLVSFKDKVAAAARDEKVSGRKRKRV